MTFLIEAKGEWFTDEEIRMALAYVFGADDDFSDLRGIPVTDKFFDKIERIRERYVEEMDDTYLTRVN